MTQSQDEELIESWHKNAMPWTRAVRNAEIESRALVTDQAILDAILSRSPRSALDIGCGEGWLSRALSQRGIDVTGIDVVPELIEKAKNAGGGVFHVASYEEVAKTALSISVDVAVCNFSLIGNESVDGIMSTVPRMLNPSGSLVVQTIHPIAGSGGLPYEDGWRSGSWPGFNSDFIDPPPWYFRTMTSWEALFTRNRMALIETREPTNPHTRQSASIIFIAESKV
jgi:2-polyprenyl-3-methyl-5-hydroxy-6-metoxy-1,4-benzoquinol methylase